MTGRGGRISNVTKSLDYLVVGGMGSAEWKHGSYGLKIEKAVTYREAGVPLRIVHEERVRVQALWIQVGAMAVPRPAP